MSHPKKYQSSLRYGIFDLCLGFLTTIFPIILLKNFLYAFCYIFVLSTISSLNAISISKKMTFFPFSTSVNNTDDCKYEKMNSRKGEKKEFSIFRSIIILICTILANYILCVLFGAPLFESYKSTLYFCSLMAMLTIYPLLWYFFVSDSFVAVVKVFSDMKFENLTESHLHSFTIWTVVGGWAGAFPIPLDWDRPWQTWPITCCIGASVGYAAAHYFMGIKLLYSVFKERKKSASSRSV